MGGKRSYWVGGLVLLLACIFFYGCGQNENTNNTSEVDKIKASLDQDQREEQQAALSQKEEKPVRPQGRVPVVVPQISQKSELPNIRIVEPEQEGDIASNVPGNDQASEGEQVAVAAETQDDSSVSIAQTPLRDSLQLITVVTPRWSSNSCVMQLYTRTRDEDSWTTQGDAWPCAVGRNGVAWGRGKLMIDESGPRKREGDGKSPAGMFDLSGAFGRTPVQQADTAGVTLNYREITPDTVCVNQWGTEFYNTIVDVKQNPEAAGLHAEQMYRSSETNTWGLIIEHNRQHPVEGAGTCVFVNVWPGPRRPTGGSVGSDIAHIHDLVLTLDPRKNPVLVVLPKAVYQQKSRKWGLPVSH
ncbi:hypothetical protein [Desulfovibrio inopinatus]|uniref:hypothetical protein n=1 Tax=Desulfovibrio inopinatus TaxID=102109 RepID=UPI00040931AB|nr:hypothetical protein [Desulfovibrio inopinatus]